MLVKIYAETENNHTNHSEAILLIRSKSYPQNRLSF